MRGRHRVPASVPGEDQLEGDVGEEHQRPVARDIPSVKQVVGADDALVAHVDHVGVDHVEHDPGHHEEDQAREQPRVARDRDQRLPALARAQSGHQQAHEQVDEHRVDRRHPYVELALVEEQLGDSEAQQHEQVQVQQPQRAARIHERSQEQQAERYPDPAVVERAARLVLPGTGEQKVDLWPGPDLEHPPADPVHVDLHDPYAVAAVGHLPAVGIARVARNRDQAVEAALRQLRAHLGHAHGDLHGLARGQAEPRRLGIRRVGDDLERLRGRHLLRRRRRSQATREGAREEGRSHEPQLSPGTGHLGSYRRVPGGP